MDFGEALARMGFQLERRSRRAERYASRPNAHLTYWVHTELDGTAIFSWEFALGEYAAAIGMQVGSDDQLNTFLYPRQDARGPQDVAWVAAQIERAEAELRRFSLLDEDG